MKYLFHLLIILFSFHLQAQNLQVEYLHVTTKKGQKKIILQTLFIKGDKSLLLTSPIDDGTPAMQKIVNDDGTMGYKVRFKSDGDTRIFIDQENNTIVSNSPLFGENFIIKEATTSISWNMTGATKTIAEHTCHEAIGEFRGRTYSAWFTLDIPVSVGPFKFTGLPGLILEVNDKEGSFSWLCKSIAQLPQGGEAIIKAPTKGKLITLPDFYDLIETTLRRRFEAAENSGNFSVTPFKLDRNTFLERVK